MRSLIPYYVTRDTQTTNTTVVNLARALVRGDMDGMLRLLQTFLSTVPYCDRTDYEGHYQQMLYIIFSLLRVRGRGSTYPDGTGGHGDAHGHHALHRGTETEPICRGSHAAD